MVSYYPNPTATTVQPLSNGEFFVASSVSYDGCIGVPCAWSDFYLARLDAAGNKCGLELWALYRLVVLCHPFWLPRGGRQMEILWQVIGWATSAPVAFPITSIASITKALSFRYRILERKAFLRVFTASKLRVMAGFCLAVIPGSPPLVTRQVRASDPLIIG